LIDIQVKTGLQEWERFMCILIAGGPGFIALSLVIANDRDKLREAFINEAKIAIEQDVADVICHLGAAVVEMDKKM
jgi:hypothetical protein